MIRTGKSKPKRSPRLILLVSFIIVITDILFIVVNYHSSTRAFEADINSWATETRQIFQLTLDSKGVSMQQIATYVANTPEVQNLFLAGKNAFEKQRGIDTDRSVSSIRDQLYRFVKPSWEIMTSQYDVRQLHFHLGPGSTSFLRVHRPDKHGDNMDNVRFTVVDVNKGLKPVRGFETGRVYSGIRGVVPVFAENKAGERIHVGALEAGTAFTNTLGILHGDLGSNLAVLLSEQHVSENMWPDFVKRHFSDKQIIGPYYVESTTTGEDFDFLNLAEVRQILDSGTGSGLVTFQGAWEVCVFPLRDYRGTIDASLPPAGLVVVWKDASDKWALFLKSQKTNIIYAVCALILVETLLVLGWRYSQKRLQDIIDTQTSELHKLATTDGLTGAYNHRTIEQLINKEIARSKRYENSFSVLMIDVDHFKKVNDEFGHLVGDNVLIELVKRIKALVRDSDVLGRWGGEEFLLLAAESDLETASLLAERIRTAISHPPFAKSRTITVSIGVTQFHSSDNSSTMIARADEALYKAKNDGRNRVIST